MQWDLIRYPKRQRDIWLFTQREIAIIADVEQAAAIVDPARIRILECLREAGSASSVARILGVSRQRVGYHIRILEEHGLLRPIRERRRGNCIERILITVARKFVISPEALGPIGVGRHSLSDQLSSSGLISVAARMVSDVGALAEEAVRERKRLPTLALETEVRFASAAAQSAYASELAAFLTALEAKHGIDGAAPGRSFRFVVCGHPSATADDISPPPERPPA